MSLQLGDTAPNFIAKTSMGQIDFYDYVGNSWAILFSHPADYTPVCTTELGQVAALKSEFEKRDVKVIGLSVDPLADHISWIKDINETQGCTIEFPIIADEDRKVSELYEFIHPKSSETETIRLWSEFEAAHRASLQHHVLDHCTSSGSNGASVFAGY